MDGERFVVPVKTWLAERTRLDSLPLTADEARWLEEESRAAFEGTDLCLIWGVNLREEPTSRSRSLGDIIWRWRRCWAGSRARRRRGIMCAWAIHRAMSAADMFPFLQTGRILRIARPALAR